MRQFTSLQQQFDIKNLTLVVFGSQKLIFISKQMQHSGYVCT